MRRTFPANLEQQFDEAYRKANLVCSKAELLAYNNRPNKHGSPRRPKNAFFIFTVESRERMEVGLYSSTTTQSRDVFRHAGQAWQRLSAGERRVYVLAASVVEKKFYEDNPGYVYNPRRGRSKQCPPRRRRMNFKTKGSLPRYTNDSRIRRG
ncbi:224_t:CDS:1 [Paraglomus occultum]|uniref:224_t:CDS:1 n=1 Tax=Paraglomus occultum TaxID=144539 RepID=A0A9N9CVU0_9GLOM|nr:224_t:CDS:1 [Paraglomus occultum]